MWLNICSKKNTENIIQHHPFISEMGSDIPFFNIYSVVDQKGLVDKTMIQIQ